MTMYYELMYGQRVVGASTSLVTIKEAYAKYARNLLGWKFGSYDEARSFIFEAGLEDVLYIKVPEHKDEDEHLVSTP